MIEILSSSHAWFIALFIFVLRVADMTIGTLRIMLTSRSSKTLGWVLGFLQALVFVVAITYVFKDLTNILNIIGYASGFATGHILGIVIEERLAIGHSHLRIISIQYGSEIADSLRDLGFAVTEIPAKGRDGTVTLLTCSSKRKDVKRIKKTIQEIDSAAFVTSEDVQPLRRGYFRA